MVRVRRRRLVVTLGISFGVALGLLLGATAHEFLRYTHLPTAVGHLAMEAFLWAGGILAVGVFAAAMVGFRREVRVEKHAMRQRRALRDLLRLARDDDRRMNN